MSTILSNIDLFNDQAGLKRFVEGLEVFLTKKVLGIEPYFYSDALSTFPPVVAPVPGVIYYGKKMYLGYSLSPDTTPKTLLVAYVGSTLIIPRPIYTAVWNGAALAVQYNTHGELKEGGLFTINAIDFVPSAAESLYFDGFKIYWDQ